LTKNNKERGKKMKQPEIIVLGAGYAGLRATIRLAKKTHKQAHVTLVNASPVFVERVRLHQQATGQNLRQLDLARLVASVGADFVQGYVTSLNLNARTVTVRTADGERVLSYDKLLYALGSTIDRDSVPGVREYADVLTPERSTMLYAKLAGLRPGSPVVVVGGGLTGLEAASEIAENYPDLAVKLVTTGDFADKFSRKGQTYLRNAFERMGITVQDNTNVERLTADEIITTQGNIAYAVVVWAGAFAVAPVARESGLTVNSSGQIVTNHMLQSVSHPDVYAAGDAAQILDFQPYLRMSCQTALPMAATAATNVWAALVGTAQKTHRHSYAGSNVSLGRNAALIQVADKNDRPLEFVFTGRFGAMIKEYVCRFAAHVALDDKYSFVWLPGYRPQYTGATREAEILSLEAQ
jgi:NADH:ubiquinone reductase (H+-translocating)